MANVIQEMWGIHEHSISVDLREIRKIPERNLRNRCSVRTDLPLRFARYLSLSPYDSLIKYFTPEP